MYRFILSLLVLVALPVLAEPPSSFNVAKRIAWEIHADHKETFYCGCSYSGPENTPDLASCGYEVRKQEKRANRIEWEHVMPAYDFGRALQCWQDGGRKNCQKNSEGFKRAEADLVNLVPSLGETNGDRSNMRLGMIAGKDFYKYGQCDSRVSFVERTFQPRPEVRGWVARTYWYMRDTYGIQISNQQNQLFTAWNRQYSVTDWERLRNRRIAAIQGHGNPYVEKDAAPAPLPSPASKDPVFDNGGDFSCKTRKTCGMMNSCEEAMYQMRQCGNTRLDGNKDGVPCQSICS